MVFFCSTFHFKTHFNQCTMWTIWSGLKWFFALKVPFFHSRNRESFPVILHYHLSTFFIKTLATEEQSPHCLVYYFISMAYYFNFFVYYRLMSEYIFYSSKKSNCSIVYIACMHACVHLIQFQVANSINTMTYFIKLVIHKNHLGADASFDENTQFIVLINTAQAIKPLKSVKYEHENAFSLKNSIFYKFSTFIRSHFSR